MAKVALSGYATIDYVSNAALPIVPTGTNTIEVVEGGFPRTGGAPLFAGQALLAQGHAVAPIVSIGSDENGALLRHHMRIRGMSPRGVSQIKDGRTAMCFLVHQPGGGYCCFLDRGSAGTAKMTAIQRAIVKEADWIVIAAGPRSTTAEVLSLVSPVQKVAWIVKADEVCFPQDLRMTLRSRASMIFLNRHERDFLGAVSVPEQVIFETDGHRGVRVLAKDEMLFVGAEPMDVNDATGAGDTFAGAAMATLFNAPQAFEEASLQGMAAVRALLRGRNRALT
ncbi:MAG: PfkB family carbohydrate kinase [Novosphingobium sp.]